ncbi:MAG: hypothetical protein WA118_12880 [Carboxydocellales bacterium]|jgi:hypothetical protein
MNALSAAGDDTPIVTAAYRRSKSSDIQISPNGIPICSIGVEMKPNGHDNLQNSLIMQPRGSFG